VSKEDNQIPKGYLADFEGKPVLASCVHCMHCSDVSDGPEYGPENYACEKSPSMSNLKGFPFKTAQECCVLHYSFSINWDVEAEKSNNANPQHHQGVDI